MTAGAVPRPGETLPLFIDLCSEGVTRGGEFQPCEKAAVAVRIDPTEGEPYAVCAFHARAEMVPLSAFAEVVRADEREKIAQEAHDFAETWLYDGDNDTPLDGYDELNDWADGLAARLARDPAAAQETDR